MDDVELPPWARGDAARFVEINRAALESEIVSQNLHLWIDLIFGCRQRDKASDNLFFPLTYQGNVDVAALESEAQREAVELQINEFGQTPKQVFFSPHPRRFSKVPALGKEPSFLSGSLRELLGAVEVTAVPRRPPEAAAVAAGNSGSSGEATDWELEGFRQKAGAGRALPRLHRERVAALDCDAERLVSVSRDGFLKVHVRRAANRLSKEEEGKEEDEEEEEGALRQTRASSVCGAPLTCCQLLSPEVVLAGALDSRVHCFSIPFGKCVQSLPAHDDTVSALRCSGARLVTGGWDTLVRLWHLREPGASAEALGELQELECRVTGGCFVCLFFFCLFFSRLLS